MKLRIPHILCFTFALSMSVPAIQTVSVSTADAAPGSTLSDSRKSGRRVHKVKAANQRSSKDDDDDGKKKKKSSNSTPQATGQPRRTNAAPRPSTTRPAPARTTRRTSTTRHRAQPQGPARATGRTRPAGTSSRATTTRHRSNVRTTRHSSSRTEVHHHYYDDNSRQQQVSTARRVDYDESPSTVDAYFTLGLGMSGFAASQIADGALAGMDWNLGLGVKGSLFGGELGVHGGAYSLGSEPGQDSNIDFTIVGVSLDLKLQPAFSFFEPYALIGFGGYGFQDGEMQETAGGGAIRLGAGADFRFNDFAIGARYLYTAYALSNNSSYRDLSVQTESVGINASFYF